MLWSGSTQTTVDKIIDDLWIDIFCFLSVKNFLSIGKTCRKFHSLITDGTVKSGYNNRINNYWETQCKNICDNIDANYETDEWFKFYCELKKIIKRFKYDSRVSKVGYNKNSEKYEQVWHDKPIKLKHQKVCRDYGYNSHDDYLLLHQPCESNCIHVLKMLLFDKSNRNDINKIVYSTPYSNPFNSTQAPLYLACKHGYIEIVDYLLSFDNIIIDIKTRDLKQTPLMIAIEKGFVNIVKMLVTHNKMTSEIINAIDKQRKNTPLIFAVEKTIELMNNCKSAGDDYYNEKIKDYKEIIHLLFNNGANINICDNRGKSALDIAITSNCNMIIKLLMQRTSTNYNNEKFYKISGYDDDSDTMIEQKTIASALHIACSKEDVSNVELLLKFYDCSDYFNKLNSYINIGNDTDGDTGLMISCSNGNLSIIKLLLNESNYNCNLFVLNKSGYNCFSFAAINGYSHILKILYHYSIEKSNYFNKSIYNNHNIDAILSKCINHNENMFCQTPYLLACENGDKDTIDILKNVYKAKVSIQDCRNEMEHKYWIGT